MSRISCFSRHAEPGVVIQQRCTVNAVAGVTSLGVIFLALKVEDHEDQICLRSLHETKHHSPYLRNIITSNHRFECEIVKNMVPVLQKIFKNTNLP